jgi:DNA-binding CsgD family transcriptional regulator/tetratricopeptide (TPR) repeat protein
VGTLLEREVELARLHALLDSAAEGRGRVAFIGGEAGIGKSTLVSSFASEVAGTTRVTVGRCDALATPRALGPFLDVAADLCISTDHDRDALLGQLVANIRRHGSTVVVIEDAHWADDASIELLAMLGRRVDELPLLLIVTYREDEVTSEHRLRLTIGDLVTAGSTVWLGLAPLSRAGVQGLADQAGVAADDLFDRTGGNPFFVTEALGAPGDDIPTSIRLAVLARAARLERPARSVLDAVSVVPGRAEAWLVAALCEQPAVAVDECIAAGVLISDQNTYAFRHELARLAIEADLTGARRRALNQRAVDALRDRQGADPARVAHHAEAAGDDEALARSAREAFLVAVAHTAHREAVRHGERALSVQQFLSNDEVADLQMKLALSLVQLARSGEAERLAERVVVYWRSTGNDRCEAESLLVLSSVFASLGRTEDAMLPLAQAIEILQRYEPGRELALAYVRLASMHMVARERDPAVEWGQRAIALATQQDDAALLGRAMIETGIADVMDNRFDGLHLVRKGIEIGRQRDLPGIVTLGLSQIGSGCGEMRRYADAVAALVEGTAFAAQHNLEQNGRYMVAWLARCRFDLGEWDEAELLAREAASSRTVAIARFVGMNTLGWLRARRGEPDVFPLLDEALEIARVSRHLQRLWPSAVARAEAGWLEDALDEHVPFLEEMLEEAIRCRHGIAAGEIGVWLHRAGRLSAPSPGTAEPFASWISGDLTGASVGFRQMGCPYEAAHALAETNESASLRVALATFRRLGAAPMIGRVTSQLRALGARVPSSTVNKTAVQPKHASGLTDREQEVLKLVSAGFTNPQIASSLYISRKTAEHHVSNILMKLGAATRSEAAATAIRLGLAG